MPVHLRGLFCPFHSSVSFVVHIFISKATCMIFINIRDLCSKTGYLRHSVISACIWFPPQHDTPGFLCKLNPVGVSMTVRDGSYSPDMIRYHYCRPNVSQDDSEVQSFIEVTTQRMALRFFFVLRCYCQKQ